MKSVIHEASSIAKAIEQGWVKAGKPKDFTVKIFEEPTKNFLGFTTKNAKVGIFVEDRQQQRGDHRQKKHAPQQRRSQHRGDWRRQQTQQNRRPDDQDRSRDRRFENRDGRPDEQRQHNQERPRDQQHEQRPHHTSNNDDRANGNGAQKNN